MSNLAKFPDISHNRMTPQQVADKLIDRVEGGGIEQVFAITYDKDGNMTFLCSDMSCAAALWLLECSKLKLMGL